MGWGLKEMRAMLEGQPQPDWFMEQVLSRNDRSPLPLLSALIDPSVIVNEYVHQDSGKHNICRVADR